MAMRWNNYNKGLQSPSKFGRHNGVFAIAVGHNNTVYTAGPLWTEHVSVSSQATHVAC